jgi:SAM-dependent methyltransferase
MSEREGLDVERVAACPVCGGPDRIVLYDELRDRVSGAPGEWTLKRCSCGAGYLDPRPTDAALPLVYESCYPRDPSPDRAPGFAARARRAVRNGYLNARCGYRVAPATRLGTLLVAPFPRQRRRARLTVRDLPFPGGEARLLDVGCGSGAFLLALRETGWDVEGLEPDPRAAAIARACGLVVHEGTLANTALGRYDAVTLNHVLEHLPDPTAALRRCHEALHPGGLLWIAVPNLDSRGHRAYGRDWLGLDAPRHLVHFTASSLRHALQAAGFASELLPAGPSAWMLSHSERLRAERLKVKPRKLRLAAVKKAHDFRARADPLGADELIVLARPT